ncbi:methyltransferase domain-containing protein [Massilia sp. NEAU-DD11]|uniref:Methyltransferase domain-containing protein n=2 Tax=Massilia cellulosiltytica TaxID=2683234 RepID=A0A7X3G2R0_9BURK|nr:methyltransferase domain-containing protein [Telluria cellulosilytica]
MAGNRFEDAARVWDERYGTAEFVFGIEPNSYLARQAPLLKAGQRALAVADGEGRNSVWLARQGLRVDAFDISSAGVGKARSLAHDAGVVVNYQVSDCAAWVWNTDAYDVIAAIFIQFADPTLRAQLFAGMTAALKPGGLLIVQGYTPKQLEYNTGGPGVLDNLYTEPMLRAACAGLEIVELEEYEAELGEGKRHAGRSALVGMVARKPAHPVGDGTVPSP